MRSNSSKRKLLKRLILKLRRNKFKRRLKRLCKNKKHKKKDLKLPLLLMRVKENKFRVKVKKKKK